MKFYTLRIHLLYSDMVDTCINVTTATYVTHYDAVRPKYIFLKDLSLFLFAITAAGVVPCCGPKKSPRTSSIVQIGFSF